MIKEVPNLKTLPQSPIDPLALYKLLLLLNFLPRTHPGMTMDSGNCIAYNPSTQKAEMEKEMAIAAKGKMSACEKMIIIPELPDSVLLRISPRQALLTSRVCKAFYHHVHGITLVDQRFYLHPKNSSSHFK